MSEAKWKLVPVEPTEEMIAAGLTTGNRFGPVAMANIYTAMLSASPTPPEGGEPVAWRWKDWWPEDVPFEEKHWLYTSQAPDKDSNGCLREPLYAHPSPDTGALREALRDLLGLCEAGGDPFDEPGRPTVARARAALTKGE